MIYNIMYDITQCSCISLLILSFQQWPASTTTRASCPVHTLGVFSEFCPFSRRQRAPTKTRAGSPSAISICFTGHPVIAEINELCKTARYYRWGDKLVRLGLAFWHIISMDGLEIAATALSSTMECPTCECPKDELDRTDKLYPVRSTADVQAGVEKARAELLNRDGSIKDRCVGKVILGSICI